MLLLALRLLRQPSSLRTTSPALRDYRVLTTVERQLEEIESQKNLLTRLLPPVCCIRLVSRGLYILLIISVIW